MRTAVLPMLGLCLLLGGCDSMSDLLTFGDDSSNDAFPQTAAVAPPVQQGDDIQTWCRRIGEVARQDAARNGMTLDTQRHMAADRYKACVAMNQAPGT